MKVFSDPLYIIILVQILLVAIIDLRTRKIWHFWHFFNIALFIAVHSLRPEYYSLDWMHWRYPLGMFVVGFLLFWIKIGGTRVMGGGDGKYLTGIFLVTPTAYQPGYFESLLWVSILVASILLLLKLVKNLKVVVQSLWIKQFNFKQFFGSRFPFAPLMVIAWIWFGLRW